MTPIPLPRQSQAFQIHSADNVVTLLADAEAGPVALIGGPAGASLALREPVAFGHKAARCDIGSGESVIKFGVRIGHATRPIIQGEWVHLHNLGSDLDARSGTLDLHSGAPTDASYE